MTILDAIILGLVEGITEYLPVSSTGHLILAEKLLGLDPKSESVNAFTIVIQGGAILAVLGLYWNRVRQMLAGLVGQSQAGRRLLINLFIAFLPAAILGPMVNDLIDKWLFRPGPVIAALALGGVWMIFIDYRYHATSRAAGEPIAEHGRTIDELSMWRALGIGLFQCVAMWPGTSRSMMTIAGATMLGLKPKEAAEFCFLLGLPTLSGACVYKLGKNILDASQSGEPNMIQTLGWLPVVIGILVAAIAAALAVKWLVAFLTKHGLAAFGYYRLALAALFAILIWQNVVSI